MITITLKVPEELAARLRHVSVRRRVSRSRIVREALEEVLKENRGKGHLSAYDLMKHGRGIVKGGPRDLSRNKKYMEDYGR